MSGQCSLAVPAEVACNDFCRNRGKKYEYCHCRCGCYSWLNIPFSNDGTTCHFTEGTIPEDHFDVDENKDNRAKDKDVGKLIDALMLLTTCSYCCIPTSEAILPSLYLIACLFLISDVFLII